VEGVLGQDEAAWSLDLRQADVCARRWCEQISEAGGDDQREDLFGSEGMFEASDGLSWEEEQEIGQKIYQAYESES
jgi:hypothetical protein